jgi:Sulfotransferase family
MRSGTSEPIGNARPYDPTHWADLARIAAEGTEADARFVQLPSPPPRRKASPPGDSHPLRSMPEPAMPELAAVGYAPAPKVIDRIPVGQGYSSSQLETTDSRPMTRILIAGLPRSGTTWAAEMLGSSPGVRSIHEPDNPVMSSAAASVRAKRGMHPLLDPGELAPDYQQIWDLAFAGRGPTRGRTNGIKRALLKRPSLMLEPLLGVPNPVTSRVRHRFTHVVAKSVYATFTLEWIAARYSPRVVVVRRDPLNVVASWLHVGIQIGDLECGDAAVRHLTAGDLPPARPTGSAHERVAWSVGFLTTMLGRLVDRHPDWIVVDHAQLSAAPLVTFNELRESLGLVRSAWTTAYIEASNQPGRAYDTRRIGSELPNAWRRRLSPVQERIVRKVLQEFPRLAE